METEFYSDVYIRYIWYILDYIMDVRQNLINSIDNYKNDSWVYWYGIILFISDIEIL